MERRDSNELEAPTHHFISSSFVGLLCLKLIHGRAIARLVLTKKPGDYIFLNQMSGSIPQFGSRSPYFKAVSNYTVSWTPHLSQIGLLVITYIRLWSADFPSPHPSPECPLSHHPTRGKWSTKPWPTSASRKCLLYW